MTLPRPPLSNDRELTEAISSGAAKKVWLRRDVWFGAGDDSSWFDCYSERAREGARSAGYGLYALAGRVWWTEDPEHALCLVDDLLEEQPSDAVVDGFGYIVREAARK